MKYTNPGLLEFDGPIQTNDSGGSFVAFPYDTVQLFGTKGRIPAKMTFDGLPYTGSIVNMGQGHMCLILKSLRAELGKSGGDSVHVTVELDDGPRTITVPDDFQSAMDHANIAAAFHALAYTHRREYVLCVTNAKRPETRISRINKAVQMIAEKSHR